MVRLPASIPQTPVWDGNDLIHDQHAEQAVLGRILQCNECIERVALVADDFGDSRHARLFLVMQEESRNGRQFNILTMESTLRQKGLLKDVGGLEYLSELVDYGDIESDGTLRQHVKTIKDYSVRRSVQHEAQMLDSDAQLASSTEESLLANARSMVERLEARQSADGAIRKLTDIPNVLTLKIDPPEFFVDGLIAAGTLNEWSGLGNAGKSYLLEKMAVAVAQGTSFLGMKCRKANVLYLDFENQHFVVQDRLYRMCRGELPPNLFVWGKWLPTPVPPIGHEIVHRLVKENQPMLLIIDPLRDAHSENEDKSTDMKPVLDVLRSYGSWGTAVVLSHHVALYEGSISRGTSALFDAMDFAMLQKEERPGFVNLRITKKRWAEKSSMNVTIDYHSSDCVVIDQKQADNEKETKELKKLYEIIQQTPGLSQNQVVKASGIKRERAMALLSENTNVLWRVQPGKRDSLCYYPHSTGSQ